MKKFFFCIVGYGNHAETKIIPSLKKLKNVDICIVSRRLIEKNEHKIYKSVSSAIKNVVKGTTFIVCSPPDVHFIQSKKILKNGFDVFIEKPVTVKLNHLHNLIKINGKNENFFAENFMYKYSNLYNYFINHWKKDKLNIINLSINFIIQKLPNNTFRQKKNNYSTNLYDIGCYPISLVNELDDKAKFSLIKINNIKKINHEVFYINSNIENVKVKIKFGVSNKYENKITITNKNKSKVIFNPFFYGRKGTRQVSNIIGKVKKIKVINDRDCFEVIFSKTKKYWINTQKKRNTSMIKNLSILENLSKKYNGML